MREKKLGVIIPYRNRKEHLKLFLRKFQKYMEDKNIRYHIFVVNQDNAKLFNRGTLLNIGFVFAKKMRCDYVVFHDVDMIPIDVDYSYDDKPLHLATNLINRTTTEKKQEVFDEYFGGVTMFPSSIFEKINGYSNKYWGWGYEDTDLLFRCIVSGIDVADLKIKNINKTGQKLKLNGHNAYIKSKNFNNILNLNNEMTIYASFYPDEFTFDHTKTRDDFTVFSITGYNTELTFNSFMRYSFQTFDEKNASLNLWTKISTNHQTNIILTFNPIEKTIKMYKDGVFINEKKYTVPLKDYSLEQVIHIGCSKNSDGQYENFFKGYFDAFAVYSGILSDEEIKEISSFNNKSLTINTRKYVSASKLKLYYNTNFIKNYKLIDLSGNENDGEIINCEILEPKIDSNKTLKVPHRRNSEFVLLKHEENGFVDNKWKDSTTRWNQLRFYNEVSKDASLIKYDGLNNLKYRLYGKVTEDNVTALNVGL